MPQSLQNRGFETGDLSNWIGDNARVVSDRAYDGTYSITYITKQNFSVEQDISSLNLKFRQLIEIGGWVYSTIASSTNPMQLNIRVTFLDGAYWESSYTSDLANTWVNLRVDHPGIGDPNAGNIVRSIRFTLNEIVEYADYFTGLYAWSSSELPLIKGERIWNPTGLTLGSSVFESLVEYRSEYPHGGPASELPLTLSSYLGFIFTGNTYASMAIELLIGLNFGFLFTGNILEGTAFEPPIYRAWREIEAPILWKGVVYDLSGRRIPKAIVYLKSTVAGLDFGAISNEQGEFSREIPAFYEVSTVYVLEHLAGLNYEEFSRVKIGDVHHIYCREIARRLLTIGIHHRVEKIKEG
jgi:hypothetical protein